MEVVRNLSSVRMPRESYGQCKHDKCKRVQWLANNLCQAHWDQTLDRLDKTDIAR